MVNEHVDTVYGYIDGKLKLIKKELQLLKMAHDAIAKVTYCLWILYSLTSIIE